MTVVQVSRSKIIKALKLESVETLKGGTWVRTFWSNAKVSNKDCTVCAVGAVLRNAVLKPSQPITAIVAAATAATEGGNAINLRPTEEVRRGQYMAGLSSFFEREYLKQKDSIDFRMSRWRAKAGQLAWNTAAENENYDRLTKEAVEITRSNTIKFVEKYFPSRISIDIDGALPAKDVRVLKKKGGIANHAHRGP